MVDTRMIRLHKDAPKSQNRFAAIISLDPAGVKPCGIACRLTAHLPEPDKIGKLTAPDYIYGGSIWNDVALDEITTWLATNVGAQRALLVYASTAYGAMNIAFSLGRCVGALELLTSYTGHIDPKQSVAVHDTKWRNALGMPRGGKRDDKKRAAVARVKEVYGLTLTDDAAEAVLINDWAVSEGLYR